MEGIRVLVLGGKKVRAEISETQVGIMNIIDQVDRGSTRYNLISAASSTKTKALGVPTRYGIETYNPANLHENSLTVPWSEVVQFVREDGEWEVAE